MTGKVVVTGMGIISALGNGVDATLQSLSLGKTGIGKSEYLETALKDFPVGEVKLSNSEMSQIIGVDYPKSQLRSVLLGIIAAKEAICSAHLSADEICRTAFINGTTVGGMDKTEFHFKEVFECEGETEATSQLQYNDCGCSTDMIAEELGDFKMVTTTSTACSSAANAIVLGANLIKAGIVDIAVVGGSESLTRFHLNGFNTLMILDKSFCSPFDKNRSGINLGEGAAYIVIESEKSAKQRGVYEYASLEGYANSCDAFHQTASSENGEGAFRAMSSAMKMAHVKPEDVDYINAHGTGTPNNDESELNAMLRIWDNGLPPFSSTKGYTGHTTSASGAIESVISLLALQNEMLLKNIGFKTPIRDNASPIEKTICGVKLRNVINNSFGFGGNDTTLIFSSLKQ